VGGLTATCLTFKKGAKMAKEKKEKKETNRYVYVPPKPKEKECKEK